MNPFPAGGSWLRAAACAVVLLALSACATHKINWSSRVGTYTLDQAILELGPPDKQAPLQDGSVVAEWLTSRGSYSIGPAYGYAAYPGWYPAPPYPVYASSPDYYLRLVFGPDGKLRSWKKFSK